MNKSSQSGARSQTSHTPPKGRKQLHIEQRLKLPNGINKGDRLSSKLSGIDSPFKISKEFLTILSSQKIYFEDDHFISQSSLVSSQKVYKLKEIKRKIALFKERR